MKTSNEQQVNLNDNNVDYHHLIDQIKQLIELLKYEILLISDNQSFRIEGLISNKNNLINSIEIYKTKLSEQSQSFENELPQVKQELKEQLAELAEVSELNKKKLAKEIYFKRELVNVISNALQKFNNNKYNDKGNFDNPKINNLSAITINDTI